MRRKIPIFNNQKVKVLLNKKSNKGESYSPAQAIEDYKLRSKVEGRAEKTLEQYELRAREESLSKN